MEVQLWMIRKTITTIATMAIIIHIAGAMITTAAVVEIWDVSASFINQCI